jgi:heat shock protein HslJ
MRAIVVALTFAATLALAAPAAELEGTHWSLVELGGEAVPPDLPQEAHLELQTSPRRASGSGGCNRLTGEYERDGARLSFKTLSITERACVRGMDAEASFLAALRKVRAFRIAGPRLELLDETGRTVAAFEAAAARP